jgi:hypothetical protein
VPDVLAGGRRAGPTRAAPGPADAPRVPRGGDRPPSSFTAAQPPAGAESSQHTSFDARHLRTHPHHGSASSGVTNHRCRLHQVTRRPARTPEDDPATVTFRPPGTRGRHAQEGTIRRGYWPTMHAMSPQTAINHSASPRAFRPGGAGIGPSEELISFFLSPHRSLGDEPGVGGPRKDAPLPAEKCRCKACPALHTHRLRSYRRRCFFVWAVWTESREFTVSGPAARR